MKCSGLHCDGCGHGGAGAVVALVLAVIVLGGAVAGPVTRAIGDLIEAVLITAVSVTGLGVLGAVAYLALRAHRGRANRTTAVSFHPPAPLRAAQGRTAPRAIEAPRPSLADLRDLAARHGYEVVRRADGDRGDR